MNPNEFTQQPADRGVQVVALRPAALLQALRRIPLSIAEMVRSASVLAPFVAMTPALSLRRVLPNFRGNSSRRIG